VPKYFRVMPESFPSSPVRLDETLAASSRRRRLTNNHGRMLNETAGASQRFDCT